MPAWRYQDSFMVDKAALEIILCVLSSWEAESPSARQEMSAYTEPERSLLCSQETATALARWIQSAPSTFTYTIPIHSHHSDTRSRNFSAFWEVQY
jgi:hypothetical protein